MKKNKIIIILIFFLQINSFCFAQNPLWRVGTAITIPKKEIHTNLCYFSKYGLTDRIELQSKPLAWVKHPNFNTKITWFKYKGQRHTNFIRSKSFVIGSIHGINYPTGTLRYIQKKNIRNLIPADAEIPPIFAFRNELLITTNLQRRTSCKKTNLFLTLKIGAKFALKTDKTTLPYFSQSLYYRESSIYHDKLLWYIGLDLDGKLSYSTNYTLDIDYYSIALKTEHWAIEHKGLLYWRLGYEKRIRFVLGYKVAYSNYPQTNISVTPYFDIGFMFTPKREDHSRLFDKEQNDPFDDRKKQVRDKRRRDRKKKKNEEKEKKEEKEDE